MMTLKLNTYIFTPLLGEGGVMLKYSCFSKGCDLEAKKSGDWPFKKPNGID